MLLPLYGLTCCKLSLLLLLLFLITANTFDPATILITYTESRDT